MVRKTAVLAAQVVLRSLELGQEAIFIDVRLVQVDGAPEIDAVIANVANFDYGIFVDFTLKAKIPALDVFRFDVRIDAVD